MGVLTILAAAIVLELGAILYVLLALLQEKKDALESQSSHDTQETKTVSDRTVQRLYKRTREVRRVGDH